MTENKLSNKRVAGLLGYKKMTALEALGKDVVEPSNFYEADPLLYNPSTEHYFQINIYELPDFHADPAWTGPLILKIEDVLRKKGHSYLTIKSQIVRCKSYEIKKDCLTFPQVSDLDDVRLALVVDGLDGACTNSIEILNTALITALDALDKER